MCTKHLHCRIYRTVFSIQCILYTQRKILTTRRSILEHNLLPVCIEFIYVSKVLFYYSVLQEEIQ